MKPPYYTGAINVASYAQLIKYSVTTYLILDVREYMYTIFRHSKVETSYEKCLYCTNYSINLQVIAMVRSTILLGGETS